MRTTTRWIAVLLGILLASVALAADDVTRVVAVKGSFADVKDRVIDAIEQQGLVINYTARVGEMLERTGRDLGATKRVYDKAEVIEFCSARASRTMTEADPSNLVFCPYTIAIYTVPGETGTVYIAHRKLPESPALEPAADMLDAIVNTAAK